MRRYLAGTLLLLMLSQSPASAMAETQQALPTGLTASTHSAGRDAVLAISLVYRNLVGLITGYGARMSPPTVRRPEATLDAAALMRAQHPLRPQIREGVRRFIRLPPRAALDPRYRTLDPRAMRPSIIKRPWSSQLFNSARITPPDSASTDALQPFRVLGEASNTSTLRRTGSVKRSRMSPMTSSPPGTGIEPWWAYETRAIPGIGTAMVNVGTGNLIVSAMDVDMPERGIDLALQRVYNSQSLHDANGDDGGDGAIFGNEWTNEFDANIVAVSLPTNTITVYDMNGTACTYTSNGSGTWQPCTGEHATLDVIANSSSCQYAWTKPDGTVYVFETDSMISNGNCSSDQTLSGHLVEILGRNNNNNITFAYSYDNSGKMGSEHITEIDANHSDGHSLIMKFGLIPGTSINELATITRPDKTKLQYLYDSSGNLLEVDKPGNNSASSFPNPPQGHPSLPSGDVAETYAYATGTGTMQEGCGPRCTAAMWTNPNNPTDGSALLFTINHALELTSWQVQGVLNFKPADGTNTVLQSGLPTSFQPWYTANFVYGNGSACSNASNGTTTMCDSDGHGVVWTIDASLRVTQTQEATGGSGSTTLTTTETWDANNDLTSYQNALEFANGTSTDMSYDGNGNITEIQQPKVQTSAGSLRPTTTFSYDQYNNLTSACDAVYNAINNGACPTNTGSGATIFQYDTSNPDQAEPFGKLKHSYTPTGYRTTYTYKYNSSSEPGDFGLPTQIAGDLTGTP